MATDGSPQAKGSELPAMAEEIKALLKDRMNLEEKLEVFSLRQQFTEGDCSTPKPGLFEIRERAKWNAWMKRKGMPREEAKQRLLERIQQLKEKYNL